MFHTGAGIKVRLRIDSVPSIGLAYRLRGGGQQKGGRRMEKFIHQPNLTLLRKRLAENHNLQQEILLRLLAEEETKETPREWESEK